MAASRVGAVSIATAAWDRWCSAKRILSLATPSQLLMSPFTQSFSLRVFFMAWGKLENVRGQPRSAIVKMRSNLSIGFS